LTKLIKGKHLSGGKRSIICSKTTIKQGKLQIKHIKYINKESIQLKNKPFLPNLTIDGRKNNWVVTMDENECYIYGKLSTKKQTLWNNDNIQILHFWVKTSKDGKLDLIQCPNINCDVGQSNGLECIYTCKRKRSMLIWGKIRKGKSGKYRIHQSRKNVEYEMLNFLNVDEHKHSMIEVKEQIWINTGHYWDKKQLLDDILNDGEKKSELLNILNNNINTNKSHYKFYTDGSLMERNKVKKMGIGWLLKNEEENNTDLEFKAANVGWPSSTKAEILAIVTALIVTTPHSTIEIYTDSANAISQFENIKKNYL